MCKYHRDLLFNTHKHTKQIVQLNQLAHKYLSATVLRFYLYLQNIIIKRNSCNTNKKNKLLYLINRSQNNSNRKCFETKKKNKNKKLKDNRTELACSFHFIFLDSRDVDNLIARYCCYHTMFSCGIFEQWRLAEWFCDWCVPRNDVIIVARASPPMFV